MKIVEAISLGAAWLDACRAILGAGTCGHDGADPIRELLHLTLRIEHPAPGDKIILRFAAPATLAWMRANFREQRLVPELGHSPSYGLRLRNAHGRDQIAWVIDKLRAKPESKAATITTFLSDDAAYLPCVSLLDFKVRRGHLLLTCTCRSLDAGVKLPANLVELAHLQHEVAAALGHPAGALTVWIVSAHIYERDLATIQEMLTET
jgi:thymidylate synthase